MASRSRRFNLYCLDDGDEYFGDAIADYWVTPTAAAASPIDDVRGTADYRRHALSVLAARCLGWAWSERPLEQAA